MYWGLKTLHDKSWYVSRVQGDHCGVFFSVNLFIRLLGNVKRIMASDNYYY